MTWLIGLSIFVSGLAIGIILSRFVPAFQSSHTLKQELEDSQKAQSDMKTQMETYLNDVKSTMDQVSKQAIAASEAAAKQYDAMFKAAEQNPDIIPFFGKETSEGLLSTKPVHSVSDEIENKESKMPPTDYSENHMGLFKKEAEKET